MPNIGSRGICGHAAVQQGHCIFVFGGQYWDDGYLQRLEFRNIWMYNLYTEEWQKQVITGRRPSRRRCPSATVIGSNIYMFGGMLLNRGTNALWKLTRTPTGCFAWHEIKPKSDKKSPSPRYGHSAWEFSSKLWMFGGCDLGLHLIDQSDYLNDYGDFSIHGLENNQVLCFDPSCQEWTNPPSFGDIPGPRSGHDTSIIRDKVWLLAGCTNVIESLNDLYELDMRSLTWTMIENTVLKPYYDGYCTLTAITKNQLVMHYGKSKTNEHCNINTWILDLSSMSWREYSTSDDTDYNPRCSHTFLIDNHVRLHSSQNASYTEDVCDMHLRLTAKPHLCVICSTFHT